MSNNTVDKDDNTIEITIKKGDKVCSFETATNTIEEFKDIIMSMALTIGFDEDSIEKHFNYQENDSQCCQDFDTNVPPNFQ